MMRSSALVQSTQEPLQPQLSTPNGDRVERTPSHSTAGMFGGKAPLSGAEEQIARDLCDVRLLTFFANGEYKLD